MTDRLRRALPAILGLVLFALALEALHVELRTVSWRDLTLDIRHTPLLHLLLAAVLTVLNYAVLTSSSGDCAMGCRGLPRSANADLITGPASPSVG